MKSYLKTGLFAIIVFGILWYLIGSKSALELVENPILILALAILFVAILLNGNVSRMLNEVRYEKLPDEEKIVVIASKNNWYKNLIYKLTRSKAIAEESDILMNHEYDGIRELDNDLPPWWLYMFYISMIYGVCYLGYYHLFGGDNQILEYEKEMTQAKIEVEAYKKTAKDLVDVNSVVLLHDSADLSKGRVIFETNCAVCHLVDAGGSIGPNLTDKYWILGGGIKNIFNTITEGGREGKGMIPWNSTLKPSEVQQVASYILSLQGTIPAKAKAPEGNIWEENE